MAKLKLYSVSDQYIQWLRQRDPRVYDNKAESRTHSRKYLGVVLQIEKYYYYIPLSSPKRSDYQIAGNKSVIKKSIVPIMRIVHKNPNGEIELSKMYKQKAANDATAGYVKAALNFKKLEVFCDEYQQAYLNITSS